VWWWWLLIPLASLVVLFGVEQILLGRAVRSELRRRRLRAVPLDDLIVRVDPAPGWRVADTGTFERDGQRLLVTVIVRGWFRHELSVSEEPIDNATQERRDA